MRLCQPILAAQQTGKPVIGLPTADFINLLREEEDYYPADLYNTRLMLTRLRKIFYDEWGWNTELIEGAAAIESRYITTIVEGETKATRSVTRYQKNKSQPKYRTITYRSDDKVYGDTRVGQTPYIYQNSHQETTLPDGNYCDIAHILAGLDAFNYPQVVTPLPNFLSFLTPLFPHVDKNTDVVTWLGDIASSAGDFLFAYFANQYEPLSIVQEQTIINKDAPASDMLGNIDAFVIHQLYDTATSKGWRVTDILEDYYFKNTPSMNQRMLLFCNAVGLKDWNGCQFSNEKEWLKMYKKQLRDNTTFQVFSLTDEKLKNIWLPIKIWFNRYDAILQLEPLLQIFLDALKSILRRDEKPIV